ncbi:MAG: hypothetical protein AB1458_08175 [Bacteroidota bacterium]
MEKTKTKKEMDTLVTCLNLLNQSGFDKQFKATKDGLQELSSMKVYRPENIKVLNFYRFEGISDPADNAILYAIETDDGTRGTLVDAYGPYSDTRVTEFMQKVEEIHKKAKGEVL